MYTNKERFVCLLRACVCVCVWANEPTNLLALSESKIRQRVILLPPPITTSSIVNGDIPRGVRVFVRYQANNDNNKKAMTRGPPDLINLIPPPLHKLARSFLFFCNLLDSFLSPTHPPSSAFWFHFFFFVREWIRIAAAFDWDFRAALTRFGGTVYICWFLRNLSKIVQIDCVASFGSRFIDFVTLRLVGLRYTAVFGLIVKGKVSVA